MKENYEKGKRNMRVELDGGEYHRIQWTNDKITRRNCYKRLMLLIRHVCLIKSSKEKCS